MQYRIYGGKEIDVEESDGPGEEDTGGKRKFPETGDKEQPKKRKKKRKKTKISEVVALEKTEVPSSQQLIDAINKQFHNKLSPVEFDEIQLSDDHFCACSRLNCGLAAYFRLVTPTWENMMKTVTDHKGSPLVLIITSAATRATDLIRDLKDVKTEKCKIAKLFAKHIKLKEQIKLLLKSTVHIGVGTPNRIQALIESESLSMKQTKYVLLDWTWRDLKLRRLIDVPETRTDMWSLLTSHVIPQVKRGHMHIGLY
ncbi:Protein CMSS1 [Lamellibrachia satsuma]|nr:Protein CMSS1 [Lamellibrachia satsuma]